ncbi:MAG TPA: hypothetical protein VLE99_03410 [Candidatus Saccharimonadales bacterium]|nr:hypothetical protein [Candidatus Saccharimonadales bacterium]
MKQPEVLFVDWDGTLSRSKFWEGCDPSVLAPNALDQFKTYLFKGSPDFVRLWMRGDYTSRHVVGMLATQFSLDPTALHNELKASCQRMRFVDDDLPDKITRIRGQGTKVVIATDNMDTFTKWTAPALDLNSLVDGILSSYHLRALKADMHGLHSPFFSDYLSTQSIDPTQAVLLDDGPHNAVVTSLGMQFVHITPDRPIGAALDAFIKT